jgi:hypothetical protein
MPTLLFADDQVTTSKAEDNLQKTAYKLNQITTEHGLTISAQNTKLVTFKRRESFRSKIVIDDKIIEQVNCFNYLGNLISYENEVDTDNKLNNYLKITGIINNVFRLHNILKKTRIKLYDTLALPAL